MPHPPKFLVPASLLRALWANSAQGAGSRSSSHPLLPHKNYPDL